MSNRNPDPVVWMRLARDDMATVSLLMTEHKKRVEIIPVVSTHLGYGKYYFT